MSTNFECPKCGTNYTNEKRFNTHVSKCNKHDNIKSITRLDELIRQSEKSERSERSVASRASTRSLQYSESRRESEREPASRSSVHDHCKREELTRQEMQSIAKEEQRRRVALEEKERIERERAREGRDERERERERDKGNKEREILEHNNQLREKIEKLRSELIYMQRESENRVKKVQETYRQHIEQLQNGTNNIAQELNEARARLNVIDDKHKQDLLKVDFDKENLKRRLEFEAQQSEERANRILFEKQNLQTDLQDKELKIQTLERSMNTMSQNCFKLQIEYNNLDSKYKSDYESKHNELKAELQRTKQEYEEKVHALNISLQKELLKKNDEVEQKRKEIESEIHKKNQEIGILKNNESQALDRNKQIITEYEKRLQHLDHAHKNDIERIHLDHRNQKIAYELECDKKIHEIRDICSQKVQCMENELNHYKNQLLQGLQNKKEDSEKVKDLQKRIEQLDRINQESTIIVEKLNSDNELYRNRVVYLDHEVEVNTKKIKELTEELENQREVNRKENVQYQIDLNRLIYENKMQVERYEREIIDLNKLLLSREKVLIDTSNDSDSKLHESNLRFSNTSKEYKSLVEQFTTLKRNNDDVISKLITASSELDSYKAMYNDVAGKRDKLIELVEKQKVDMEVLRKEAANSTNTSRIATLALQREVLIQHDKYKKGLAEKEENCIRLEAKCKENAQFVPMYYEAKKQLDQLQIDIQVMDKKHRDIMASTEARYKLKIEDSGKEISVLRDEVKRIDALTEKIKHEYEERILNMKRATNFELQSRIDNLAEEVRVKNLILNEKDERYKQAELKLLESIAQNNVMMENNIKKEEELDKKMEELSRQKHIPVSMNDELKKSQASLFAKLREKDVQMKKLEEANEKLAHELKIRQDMYDRELSRCHSVIREFEVRQAQNTA